MGIEIHDNEDAASALDAVETRLALRGRYEDAGAVGDAKRRMRADDDEKRRMEAEIAELRADLEWYAAHRCIGYKDRISFSVKPYSTFCLRKEVEHDGTTADLLRVIRAARKGEI